MAPKPLQNKGPFEQFDERDSVFARTRLVPGTQQYNEYYARHPQNKNTDQRTRSLKNLAAPGTHRYTPGYATLVESQFEASDLFAKAVENMSVGTPDGLGEKNAAQHSLDDESPKALTTYIKEAAFFLGANDVGITKLEPGFVYSHRGRPLGQFGNKVELPGTHAIVMVFSMRSKYVATSPQMPATAETARVYQQAGAASYSLAGALGRLGFSTRAHVDSNYQVICPPLAVAAGLGELGRNGILIHKNLGPGIRLSVVTIDAKLETDEEGCWGIADFCKTCAKCARSCPAKAIPEDEPVSIRGATKWPMNPERCYHYWRTQGTDCGVCVRVCPFAKPDTFVHRIVRGTICGTTIFNKLLLKFDDIIYGSTQGL